MAISDDTHDLSSDVSSTNKSEGAEASQATEQGVDSMTSSGNPLGAAPGKKLPPAAIRALEEAADRRAKAAEEQKLANEKGGPKGPEPTRFGDWERKGRAVDFS